MKKPYIGITGFTTQEEATEVLKECLEMSNRLVMIGVLVSSKTLRGLQNKWPNRYPKIEKVAKIFPQHPLALNLIHYNTKEPDLLYSQLIEVAKFGGKNLDGFQLNMAWPSSVILKKFRLNYPEMQIVLQIGSKAFSLIQNSPEKLATKVAREYNGLIDYLLLDLSGGLGRSLETKQMRGYLQALKNKNLNIGLGVAGGLSPTTLRLVEPLVKDFPDLSIDAEGRLRDQEDFLNLDLAQEYLRRARQMFND